MSSVRIYKSLTCRGNPGPARNSTIEYANWQSDQVESLVILWVRLPPRSLDPVVQGQRRLRDKQESDGSSPSGITYTRQEKRSVGVSAAHLRGRQGDRVQFPDRPLDKNEVGLLVQWKDA